MELQKILVGVDGSEPAEIAVSEAVAIARHTGAHVCLAYATTHHEPIGADGGAALGGARCYDDIVSERLAHARQRLGALREEVRAHGVYCSIELIEAAPDAGLIDEAARMSADLIVVGTHGYTGFRRLLMGSVAERVVRGAATSVMVARARSSARGAFRRVLVPVDFSEPSIRALEMALVLSAPDVEIDLLHVWQVPPPALPYAAPVSLGTAYAELRAEIGDSIEQRAERLMARYRNAPATLRFRHEEDTPVHGIQRVLESGDYGCAVVGSHGRHGLRRWLLGSVAEQTVRYAPCSVVVVRCHD